MNPGRSLLASILASLPALLSASASEVVDSRTSVGQLNESVVFYASFDGEGAAADLATGPADPIRIDGRIRFVSGRFGKALLLGAGGGGAALTYASAGQLDLRRPGALSFWVRPHEWIPADAERRGYVRLLGFEANPGQFVIERMGFDRKSRRQDLLIVGAFDLPKLRRLYVGLDGTESWDAARWHLVVLNWDPDGFEISLDGTPFERRAMPGLFDPDAFARDGVPMPFVVGGTSAETTAIDELTLYSHALRAEDVARLLGR